MKRVQARVTGDVQGVFYRFSAKIVADGLGITGWAKNESDKSVFMILEGDDKAIKEFIAWAKEGSPMAEVDEVKITNEEYKGEFKDFEVR